MAGIIGTLPANLQNGTVADASQVMSDLNFIVNQVNANAQPAGSYAVLSGATFTGIVNAPQLQIGNSSSSSEADLQMFNSNTQAQYFVRVTDGSAGFYDIGRNIVRWFNDTTGNFTVAGNLTANSDENLKTDWTDLPGDFIERLAGVLHGTFTRTDTGARQVGVGARSLRGVLPEAVMGDDVLSVAYGNAALVAAIQLAREVVELRKRIAELEAA
ncbi:hypothetical protein [Burkholderia ubonensis]|uniref:hypothetical protein n=1 Tax=Burkholderia ubonensis TaxID=101571 RepID=UPI000A9C0B44|nr:hypothetical protein [Burkholderia ubonensis]